jgi:hypothetical protein
MTLNLLDHPLGGRDWELAAASPIRTFGRALWRSGDDDTRWHIVHGRAVQGVAGPLRLERIGLQRGNGYHKCASAQEFDAPAFVRLLAHRAGAMVEVGTWELDEAPGPNEVVWFPAAIESELLFAIIERSFVDDAWPSWNLAKTGLLLDGEAPSPWRRPDFGLLATHGDVPLTPAPGVRAIRSHDEVRFATNAYAIGFRLRSPTLSFLAVDADRAGRTDRNLLQQPRNMDIVRTGIYPAGVYPVLRDPQASYLAQGPRLTRLDGLEPAGFLGFSVGGSVTLDGNRVIHDLVLGSTGVRYRLTWTLRADGFDVETERAAHPVFDAWISSAWHFATNNRVAASTLLGELVPIGETGLVRGPATWHHPGHGSFVIETSGDVLLRSDSVRPLDTNTLEIKLHEAPQVDGTYRLAGDAGGSTIRFEARTPRLAATRAGTPPAIARAIDRHLVTALTFRADTSTYSNNGGSMHCSGSLNPIGDIVRMVPRGRDGIDPASALARSVERWLSGAPGYGSGNSSRGDFTIGDEYVMLASDGLCGLGRLLEVVEPAWLTVHEANVDAALDAMRGRDVDGDGLVESRLRLGASGEHQWGSSWADVVSFGWKDAWANAVLYRALRMIAAGFARLDRAARAAELDDWATRLRASYVPTFFNAATGWIAGWRSMDGTLHDHGYPLLNGDAIAGGLVDDALARSIMERLWSAFGEVGYRDFANGIPINLYPIPEDDLGGVVFGLPIGGYLQGGATHHRTGGFVEALYRVGKSTEADLVLEALASSTASDTSFGGLGSGLDWRLWDGTPSGYEGLLAEGFGFLAVALERYGQGPARDTPTPSPATTRSTGHRP